MGEFNLAFAKCENHPVPVYYDPSETGGFCPSCAKVAEVTQPLPLPEVEELNLDTDLFDMVNCPQHYNQGKVECIDAMKEAFGEEAFRSHCVMTAFKYVWRCYSKFNFDEDVQKAIWYLRMARGDDPRN